MVPDEYFCMENSTIIRKKLIRVNGTRWSVLLHAKSNNFQKKAYKGQWYQVLCSNEATSKESTKKTYTGQFIVELIRVNKMAYKGHLRQPPQSYILTNIQRFKSKRGPEGSFRRETALRTKHITPGHTF